MDRKTIESRVLAALKAGPLTTTEISDVLCGRAPQLSDVLCELVEVGLIDSITVKTGGRPRTTWRLPEVSAPGGQAKAVDTAEARPSLGRDLSLVEVDKLILALVRGMGDLGASEKAIARVLGWAMQTPETFRSLALVFDGKLWLRVYGPGEGEISFVAPARV